MRVPVLTYHAINISGNDYATNDHVAFAEDLRLITQLGLRIVPLQWVVDQLLGLANRDLSGCVALSCDDGADFDYFDLDHPTHGRQRSLFNCLLDFRREYGRLAQPYLHLSSFVIVSPQARKYLDQSCLVGRNWWACEAWWRAATLSALMSIENHSWDHNHTGIPLPGLAGMQRGSFHEVNTHERATLQIAQATHYINTHLASRRCNAFCYPFGHANDYLRQDYFPHYQQEHGLQAAFSDGATPVTLTSEQWYLPRYICGWHWKSSEELRSVLNDAL